MYLINKYFKDKNFLLIIVISIPFCIIYSQMAATLQCDATTAINYARGLGLLFFNLLQNIYVVILNPDLISKFFELPSINLGHFFYRPPGFPLFIILSGFFIFESIWTVYFLYLLISFSIPLITYSIFKTFLKTKIAFYFTVLLIVSTLPFGFITYFLADNLLVFAVFMSTFYFIHFYKKNKYQYLVFSSFFGTIAFMTRTEGLISLICLFLFSLLILFINKKNKFEYLKTFLSVVSIPFAYIILWTGLVSYSLQDFKAFGNITFGSGYFSMYTSYLGHSADKIEAFLDTGFFKKKYSYTIDDLYADQVHKVFKLVDPDNGPASKELYDKIEDFLTSNPDSIDRMLTSFENAMNLSSNYTGEQAFYEMFGKFKNNPTGLAENYFNRPDNFYLDFFNAELINIYGTAEIYSLYQKIYLETLISNPVKIAVYLENYFKTYSIDLNCTLNFFISNKFNCPNSRSIITLALDRTHYIDWWFDPGKCPSSVLTSKAFERYKNEWEAKVDNIDYFLTLDKIKISYRILFGYLYLLAILLVFFVNNKLINFYFLFLSQGNIVATVLGAGGSVATRNEHLNLMLMIIFTLLVFSNIRKIKLFESFKIFKKF